MTRTASPAPQSLSEEIANCLTHGVGLGLAVAGLVALSIQSAVTGDAWTIVGASVFGASLVFLYLTSTLYHGLPHGAAKRVMRNLDHTAIYLLIAGTYTPVTLITLRGPWGWTLFGIVWGLAILGVAFQFTHLHRMGVLRVLLYVAMGWAAVIAAGPLLRAMEPGCVLLILIGGVAYTSGIAFYAWERLRFNHAIWHLFVLAGSVLHFIAVRDYIA